MDLTRTLITLGGASLALASTMSAQGVIRQKVDIAVGPTVHVSSANPTLIHTENLAAGDPRHSGRLTSCVMVQPTDSVQAYLFRQVCYGSFDGGNTWTPTLTTNIGWSDADPAVWYGKGDTVYMLTLTQAYKNREVAPPPDAPPQHADFTIVYRSLDGGRTWSEAGRYDNIDRQFIVVDDNPGGPYSGRIYTVGQSGVRGIAGTRAAALYMRWSADGGKTWMGPTYAAYPQGTNIAGVATGAVLSDGTLVGFFGLTKAGRGQRLEADPAGPNGELHVITSRDGGQTFDPSHKITDWTLDRPRSEGAQIGQLAVDRGSRPFKDRLYVVFPEVVEDRVQVRVSYSADKGKTWSAPVTVNDDRSPDGPSNGPDHLLPAVGVNKDGVVLVTWYDRRDAKDNLGWRMRAAASLDGGETFSASVPISQNANTFTTATPWSVIVNGTGNSLDARFPLFFTSAGHTTGLAVDADGTFHPTWIDNHTGLAQLWSAAITVRGTAQKNGAVESAELDDISSSVTLETSRPEFDQKSGVLTLTARLRNISRDTIKGPVRVRVLTMQSEVAVPEILNADNGEHGTGAIWDFTSLIPAAGLASLELSQPKTLRVQVRDVRPLRAGKSLYPSGIFHMKTKTIGKLKKAKGGEPDDSTSSLTPHNRH